MLAAGLTQAPTLVVLLVVVGLAAVAAVSSWQAVRLLRPRLVLIVRAFAEIESSRLHCGTEHNSRNAHWPPPVVPTNVRT